MAISCWFLKIIMAIKWVLNQKWPSVVAFKKTHLSTSAPKLPTRLWFQQAIGHANEAYRHSEAMGCRGIATKQLLQSVVLPETTSIWA